MWGDRRWPICHSWIAARESSSQLVVLVLWPRRGVLAGRVREGAAAAVKTNPGRELRHCMRRQFLRLLLGRASDRPWSQSPRRLKHCAGRLKHCAGGSSAGRFKRGAVQARDGSSTVRGGSSTARGTARGGAARGGLEGETLRGAGRSCGSSTARGGSVLAGRVIEGSAAAVKTNPSCEMRHCTRQQFLRSHRA